MTEPIYNSICEQAVVYYYDFAFNQAGESIPVPVKDHIIHCSYCNEQIAQLKSVLLSDDTCNSRNLSGAVDITNLLNLHFSFAGKKVTCSSVKPFLPILLEPDREITIPTPITAHLDNCKQCLRDIELIKSLNLNYQQLYRLSNLFTMKPEHDITSCQQAQKAISLFSHMAFNEINEQDLRHLCTCPECRKNVYQYREEVRAECLREKGEQECSICNNLSKNILFDFTFPSELIPVKIQDATTSNSLIPHLRSCPEGLARIQEIHRDVYNIAERPDSDIVTIFNIDNSVKVQKKHTSETIYSDFPVRIDIEKASKKSTSIISLSDVIKEKVSNANIKQFFKSGIVVAAVLLIAFTLLFRPSYVQAESISKIYSAIEKIKNIHVTFFVAGKPEPTQEKWASRTFNIYMYKTEDEVVSWDTANKVLTVKNLETGTVDTSKPPQELFTEIEQNISDSLNIMPFDSISDIPTDAKWNHIQDDGQPVTVENTEVYELIWTDKSLGGSTIFRKWRVYAQLETNIPQRIELYQRTQAEEEYTLTTILIVERLSDNDMQNLINK